MLAITYIIHPYYWKNPPRLIEGVRVLDQHPSIKANLFMGEIHLADALPWNYIPIWFAITAPPIALALGTLGAAAVCWQGVSRPLAALRDRETRFRIMLLGCVVLPVAVVIALQSNIYQGWRRCIFCGCRSTCLRRSGCSILRTFAWEMGIWKGGFGSCPIQRFGDYRICAQILDRRAVGVEIHKPVFSVCSANVFDGLI